jgi:outer membrane protein
MKNKIYILTIMLFFSSSVYSQKVYTLKESINTGLENSKDLKISNSKVIVSEAKISEIKSQNYPQLKFTAGYSRLNEVPPFSINVPFSTAPITVSESIMNNYSLRLSFQHTLFSGFRISSLSRTYELNKDATNYDLDKDKSDLALNIIISYWNLYKAKLIIQIIDENLKTTGQHLTDTKNFKSSGLATENDVLKLEVQYSNIKLQKLEAMNNAEMLKLTFNKSIGVDLNSNTDIDLNTDKVIEENIYYSNNTINSALENRPEIKSIQKKIGMSEQSIITSRSTYFPSLFLTGNYTFSNPNQRYQPLVYRFNGSWELGILLSWDIWNWGSSSSQVLQAEQSVLQGNTALEQLKENIKLEINQNYLALKLAKEKLNTLELIIKQAEENLRITIEKYNNQLSTSTDLIDAQNTLFTAKSNFTNSLADYQIAKMKYKKSIGEKIY